MDKRVRIIDANFNRTREGLRVIEDGIRFYLENEEIFKKIKDFRHKFIKEVIKNFPIVFLHKTRESSYDVGKNYDVKGKENIKKIIEKNCLRVEEGIRVIEEYSKCIDGKISSIFHDLRFEFYNLEKQITMLTSRKRIPLPFVYAIINLEDSKNIFNITEEIIKGKVDVIQFRYKGENIKYFVDIAKKLKKIIPDEIIYIINDRVDICEIVDADGVHLGDRDISVEDARKVIPDKIIGVSTNSLEEVLKYKGKDIDYLAIGAIYPSPTKKGRKVVGTTIIKDIKKKINIPLVAIGGINKENVNEVIKEGADGVALISSIEKAKNKEEYLKQIKKKVKKEWMKINKKTKIKNKK